MFARKYGFMSKFEKKTDLMRFLQNFVKDDIDRTV